MSDQNTEATPITSQFIAGAPVRLSADEDMARVFETLGFNTTEDLSQYSYPLSDIADEVLEGRRPAQELLDAIKEIPEDKRNGVTMSLVIAVRMA